MFVLALDELPDAARRVYTYGFDGMNRERITTELLADDGDNVHRLIVDVASRSRRYGRLAALNPRADFFPQEPRCCNRTPGSRLPRSIRRPR